jgi:hypothetical protein
MQSEKATSGELADPLVFAEPPWPVDDGLPLHAAAIRSRAAAAMMAAAVRAGGSMGIGFMPAVVRPGG